MVSMWKPRAIKVKRLEQFNLEGNQAILTFSTQSEYSRDEKISVPVEAVEGKNEQDLVALIEKSRGGELNTFKKHLREMFLYFAKRHAASEESGSRYHTMSGR